MTHCFDPAIPRVSQVPSGGRHYSSSPVKSLRAVPGVPVRAALARFSSAGRRVWEVYSCTRCTAEQRAAVGGPRLRQRLGAPGTEFLSLGLHKITDSLTDCCP